MTIHADRLGFTHEIDNPLVDCLPAPNTIDFCVSSVQSSDTIAIQSASSSIDARPSTPNDPDFFEAIVMQRSFVLYNSVLDRWLNTPSIRKTATVVYGLNSKGERVDGLKLTLQNHQTVVIWREDLIKEPGLQSSLASPNTPLFERHATGELTQTPENRVNAGLAERAGVAFLSDIIDPDNAEVVAIVDDLIKRGLLKDGMSEADVFRVVDAEMLRRYPDRYQTDGNQDRWQLVQQTLQRGRGDCEDWSIAMASVLARALLETGHSPDDVYLHIIKDGDQAHMIVQHGDRVWDIKEPERIRDYSDKPIVTISQTKVLVEDESSVDWLLATDTASGFNDVFQQGPPEKSLYELVYLKSNQIHEIIHGGNSEMGVLATKMATNGVTIADMKAFYALQRKFDSIRGFFVLLMQVVNQIARWRRMIFSILEGTEANKDSADYKYSFEGINFNELTEALIAGFIATIEAELAENRKKAVDEHTGLGHSIVDMMLGNQATIDQLSAENEAVKQAYGRMEELMLLIKHELLEEQKKLDEIAAAIQGEPTQRLDVENDDLVYFGNGQSTSSANWEAGSLETKGTQFATADAKHRPFFDIIESSLQRMIVKGRRLQAQIQLVATIIGFQANLYYAFQKIILGQGDLETGVQSKIFAWRASRYELFESQFVEQLTKLKQLFDESVNLTLQIHKEKALQPIKIAQGVFNTVFAPYAALAMPVGLDFLFVIAGNITISTVRFVVEDYLERQYNKNPDLNEISDEKLNNMLAAQGISTQTQRPLDLGEQSAARAYSVYQALRSKQGDLLAKSLNNNERWQENPTGALKKRDALFDVNLAEDLLDVSKRMALVHQSWVQQALIIGMILQFAIGLSIHDRHANELRGVAEKMANMIQSIKLAIEREWANKETAERTVFEREQKRRELLIGYVIDVVKDVAALRLIRLRVKNRLFRIVAWTALYNGILGGIANSANTLAKAFPFLYAWGSSNASLSDAHQELRANSETVDKIKKREENARRQYEAARQHRQAMEREQARRTTASKLMDQRLADARLNEARTKAQYERHRFQTQLTSYRDQGWGINAYEKAFFQHYKMVNYQHLFEKYNYVNQLFKRYYVIQAALTARYRVLDAIMGLSRGDRAAESLGMMSMEANLIKAHTDKLINQAKEQIQIANKQSDAYYAIYKSAIDLAIVSVFSFAIFFLQNPALFTLLSFSKEMMSLLLNLSLTAENQRRVYGADREAQKNEQSLKNQAPDAGASSLASALNQPLSAPYEQVLNRNFEAATEPQRGRSGEYFLNQELARQFNRQIAQHVSAIKLSYQALSKIAELRYMIINKIADGTLSPTMVTGLITALKEGEIKSYYDYRMGYVDNQLKRDTESNALWQSLIADTMHTAVNLASYAPLSRPLAAKNSDTLWLAGGSGAVIRQLAQQIKPMVGRLHGAPAGSDDQTTGPKPITRAAQRDKALFDQFVNSKGSYHGMAGLYQAIVLSMYYKQSQQSLARTRQEYIQTLKSFWGAATSTGKALILDKTLNKRQRENAPRFFEQLRHKNGLRSAILLGGANFFSGDLIRTRLARSKNPTNLEWYLAAKAAESVQNPTLRASLGFPGTNRGTELDELKAGPLTDGLREKTVAENKNASSLGRFEKDTNQQRLNSLGNLFLLSNSQGQSKIWEKIKTEINLEHTNSTPERIRLTLTEKFGPDLSDAMWLMDQNIMRVPPYRVSGKTFSSIQSVSRLMRKESQPTAPLVQQVGALERSPAFYEELTKHAERLETDLNKATRPDKQLEAVYNAMALARVIPISRHNQRLVKQAAPVFYSILYNQKRKLGPNSSLDEPVDSVIGIPLMSKMRRRRALRRRRLNIDANNHEGELAGVLSYLGIEGVDHKGLENMVDNNVFEPPEVLAMAIVDHHKDGYSWKEIGALFNTKPLNDINWKDVLTAVSRLIDDEHSFIPFKSRQSAVNRDISQFLSSVFTKDGVEFRDFLKNLGPNPTSSDNIDNVLAILTGLSPLKLVETAEYPYITESLLVSSFEDPKSEPAKRFANRCIRHLQDQNVIDTNGKYEIQNIPKIKKLIREKEKNQAYIGALCRALDRASIRSTDPVSILCTNPHLKNQVKHLTEPVKREIAARLLSKVGTLFVHDRDPLLCNVTQDLSNVTPGNSGSWCGFTAQEYPGKKGQNDEEYNEWQ